MEKLRSVISANLNKHAHFEEYFKIITVIEEHETNNPDICIESCKALVEGISKTILVSLDNTKTPKNIDKDDLPKLFKETMRKLAEECKDLEGDFAARFSGIIQVIGEIRNKRGDISHGRIAPKHIFSSAKLATTVVNMTESMLEYILEHYFSLAQTKGKFIYDSEEMQDYNTWLDEGVDFPIKKARYSQLLFDNDYDEYESRYSDDFLRPREEEIEENPSLKEPVIVRYAPVAEEIQETINIVEEQQNQHQKLPRSSVELLVNSFDEIEFWSTAKRELLHKFALAENLDKEILISVINKFLFTEKPPLRDDVAESMLTKPTLKDRAIAINGLTQRIMAFSSELTKTEEKP